jgi:putative proteasome-type protease
MTYCVALRLKDGLVMLSDTRTNAGVDNIACFAKMHLVEIPGERVICLMTAGNLSVAQSVVNLVTEGFQSELSGETENLNSVPTMFRAAQLIGEALSKVYKVHGESMKAQGVAYDVAILLGGQIRGRTMRLFEIYSAGNFIEATEDTPFLQIGEHKYGKPILDRAAQYDTDPYDAVKLALVSMDSTLRSNLTVGLPVDLMVYRRDALKVALKRRISEDDQYFRALRESWSKALRDAYRAIPRPDWAV